MHARAELVVQRDERGRTRPTTMFGEAPLLLRVTDHTADALTVHLVGGAAGPLGGDHLDTTVSVRAGASLRVRSVAASLVQPGPPGAGPSSARVSVTIDANGSLDWRPQPLISVAGSDHTQWTTVALADQSSSLCWVDEVVLGRHGEPGGRLTLHQRFTIDGRPVLHHTVSFDRDSGNGGGHGAARVIVSVLLAGPLAAEPMGASAIEPTQSLVKPSVRAARMPIGDSAALLIALGDDLDIVRSGLDELGFGRVSRGSCSFDEPQT